MESVIVRVDAGRRYQKWEGFGTSLMWWANAVKGFEQIPATSAGKGHGFANRYEELMGLLFDPETGLGLNIVRYNVGGGDCVESDFIKRYGARIPGYMDAEGHYGWTADSMQIKVLKDAYDLISHTDQRFYNTVFSVSPPYFMTYSGSSTGSKIAREDNLRWDQYEAFVEYFLNVASYIQKELGIPVTDIEPVNEPTSGYWKYGSPKQEGCQFNRYPCPGRHAAFFDPQKDPYDPSVYSALSKIMEITGEKLALRQSLGELTGITLTGTDETSIDEAAISFLELTEKARNYISKIATHGYAGDKRRELGKIAVDYGKKIWMSEVCYKGGTWDPEAMDEGCFQLGRDIRKDIYEMGVTGWVAWQGVESLGENLLWNGNWGFIHCLYEEARWKSGEHSHGAPEEDFGMNPEEYCIGEHCLTPEDIRAKGLCRGDYFLTKQYYVWGQYTRYLREGYDIIEVTDPDVTAAVSPEGNIVLVAVNGADEIKKCCVELKNFGAAVSVEGTYTDAKANWKRVSEVVLSGPDKVELILPERSVSTYRISTSGISEPLVSFL